MNYDISIILPTAREDYSIIDQPNLHYLKPTMDSLSKQTFKDFEVIVVDSLYEKRNYDFSKLNFHVKHVPVHSNHRFWLDRKRWSVCGNLNTGIIHSDGELLVRIDDCSEFGSDFIQKFWEGYESGYFPLAMHIRYLGGKPARLNDEYKKKGYEVKFSESFEKGEKLDILNRVYGDKGLIRDTRYEIVKAKGGRLIAPLNWYYGYSSASLEAMLKINGYDELFDGDKSLEDTDAGSRLTHAGYGNNFLLDVNHQVIEHEHKPIPESLIERGIKPIKCNYAIYLVNQRKNRWRANSDRLSDEDLEAIQVETLKPPCSPRENMYEDDCKGELFKIWSENQPLFDLRSERLEI